MAVGKRGVFAAFGRLGIVAGIVVAFALGMAGTVYLSLRSPEVTVPNVVGQHYLKAQEALEGARLNIRKRAKRHKDDARPDTVLDQSPRAGEVVKAGQTVAVIVADEQSGKNAPPEGEAAPPQPTPEPTPRDAAPDENQNRAPRANANNANRNTNRNANNRNANNRNSNNRNANNANNANGNANNRNAGANANRPNANAGNANRNTNANRNANANANRTNANRPNANAARPNSNNANRRPSP